jgi:spore photoproduct lyase
MTNLTLPIAAQEAPDIPASSRSSFPVAHRGRFIKQFSGPHESSGVVCFKFWQLVHASGCPFKCAYCFLQTTTYFRFNKAALMGQVYSNWEQMIDEVKEWLASPTPRMLIVGELQDGLAFENAYAAVTGKPLTHHLVPLFAAQNRHRLIFLTKSTLIKQALKLEPTRQVVFSWSVNAEYVGKRWEQGAPLPHRRFAAAARMQEAGWPIRFRLDPMIPYREAVENWQDGYAEAIHRINALRPEMVTIGALRASTRGLATAAEQNGRPVDLFEYLSEKDPSGFKYRLPFKDQVALYRFALERLDNHHIKPALCKEDVSVWKEVGLPFNGCHCLLEGTDIPREIISTASYKQIVAERRTPVAKPNDREHFEDYRAQTQVKHEILAAYLAPYFQIVGKTNKNLLYIDGFAGPGAYTKADTGETFDGSPLLALKLIAGNDRFPRRSRRCLSRRTNTSFAR